MRVLPLAHIPRMKISTLILIVVLFGNCRWNDANSQQTIDDESTDFKEITRILDSIHVEDQKYRLNIDSLVQLYGWESEEMKNYWEIIKQTDSSNLIIVEGILEKYGWLSAKQIGGTANSTLFLVIQHSNQEVQEKYLPMMRKAVEDGNANSRSLALLEDRIRLGRGELQIYGSQIGTDRETGQLYVLPLEDPEQVNERRLKVGLGPIENYISNWDLEWDVEEYKRNLPRYIEIMRNQRK